jgi:hypothetical protein
LTAKIFPSPSVGYRTDPRAVRENADGSISLRPGVDFRAPGNECPPPPTPATAPLPAVEVREYRGLPEFLRVRTPSVFWMVPGGRA